LTVVVFEVVNDVAEILEVVVFEVVDVVAGALAVTVFDAIGIEKPLAVNLFEVVNIVV